MHQISRVRPLSRHDDKLDDRTLDWNKKSFSCVIWDGETARLNVLEDAERNRLDLVRSYRSCQNTRNVIVRLI